MNDTPQNVQHTSLKLTIFIRSCLLYLYSKTTQMLYLNFEDIVSYREFTACFIRSVIPTNLKYVPLNIHDIFHSYLLVMRPISSLSLSRGESQEGTSKTFHPCYFSKTLCSLMFEIRNLTFFMSYIETNNNNKYIMMIYVEIMNINNY